MRSFVTKMHEMRDWYSHSSVSANIALGSLILLIADRASKRLPTGKAMSFWMFVFVMS
jgi:hypothetical protein